MIDIDPAALTVVLEAIIALLLAIIAYFNKQRTVIQQSVQTASMPVLQAPVIAPAPVVTSTPAPGFVIARDGEKLVEGLDGWYARLNPSPEAASMPDDRAWQAVSIRGVTHNGNKDVIIYLITSPDAAGWRARMG